jgi:hypothetical protein
VAIPFAPDDPVYGASDDPQGPYQGLPLGALRPRGETRLLTAPLSQLIRLRHNPFFTYLEQRVVGEMGKAARLCLVGLALLNAACAHLVSLCGQDDVEPKKTLKNHRNVKPM